MIKGIEELNQGQKDHMERVNKLHTDCVGVDYKEGMEVIEVWVDERDNVCVRLKNGDWFHYLEDGSWY